VLNFLCLLGVDVTLHLHSLTAKRTEIQAVNLLKDRPRTVAHQQKSSKIVC